MSANITTTSITPALLEVVDTTIYQYVAKQAKLYNRFGMAKGKEINARGAYVIGEDTANASWGGFTEGGSYPGTDGQTLQKMVITYRRNGMGTRLTKDALQSKAKQISETMARNITSDAAQMLKQCNRMLFQAGDGHVAVVLSVSGSTITFDAPFGAAQVLVRGKYQVYTTAGVLRGNQTEVYTVVSKSGTTVTFDGAIATSGAGGAVAAGDYLCYQGTYGLETHGLPYHINNSLTGSYQGITKTSLPEGFIPVAEDLGGGNITVAIIERNKQLIKYKPEEAQGIKHFFLASPTQHNSYKNLGNSQGQSTIWRAAQSGRTLDLQFDGIEYAGETWFEDIDCPDDTVYYLHDQIISRYEYKPMGLEPFDPDGSNFLWPIPAFDSSAAGSWKDQRAMYNTVKEDWGSVNPASSFVLNNCSTGPYANRIRLQS